MDKHMLSQRTMDWGAHTMQTSVSHPRGWKSQIKVQQEWFLVKTVDGRFLLVSSHDQEREKEKRKITKRQSAALSLSPFKGTDPIMGLHPHDLI